MWVIFSLLTSMISAVYDLCNQNSKLKAEVFIIYRGLFVAMLATPLALLYFHIFPWQFYAIALFQGICVSYLDYRYFQLCQKFGAENVFAFDIDRDAIKVAQENGKLNGSKVKFAVLNAFETEPPHADVIFANITADILKMFAPVFVKCLNEGGILILSGIIDERYQETLDVYISNGFKLQEHKTAGEWHALKLYR